MNQASNSNDAGFRKSYATSLYGHWSSTVRAYLNPLTNVVLAAEQVVIDPGLVRHAMVEPRRIGLARGDTAAWCFIRGASQAVIRLCAVRCASIHRCSLRVTVAQGRL